VQFDGAAVGAVENFTRVLARCGRGDGLGVQVGQVDRELVVAAGADRLAGVRGVGRGR
jgi:hypothetical protein